MALTDAQIAAMGFGLPVGTDFISNGDNEISKNARAAAEGIVDAQFKKTLIPANVDIREWLLTVNKAGQYYVQSVSQGVALQTGLPDEIMNDPTLYTALVSTLNSGISIELTTFSVWGLEVYKCSSAPVSAGWTEWKKVKWAGREDLAVPGSKYGYKTAALALTTPGSSTETITALSFRIPFEYSTGFKRFRLHIRNFSDRNNAPYPGVLNFTGLWFGAGNKATGSFNAAPQQLSTGFSTPADAADYVTPWFNAEVKPGSAFLISAGVSASSVTAVQSITAGYRFDGSSSYGSTQTVNWPRTTSLPFDIWIEAEVPASTPIVAELGSSSSVGSKATYPVLESPLSLYCMRVGALPMHYAHSGTTLATWDDQTLNKWQKNQDCARPDALYLSLGSNDLFGTRTLAEIQASTASIVEIIKAMATDNIYATTIEPRTVGDETKRRQYNTWLKTKPLGIRDVFDRAASISNDDETIRPEFDTDGIHTNTAGNLAKANANTRPVFQPITRVNEVAGRTITVWDYVNQREQMVYGNTGWRKVIETLPAGIAASNIWIKREGSEVTINVQNLTSTSSGTVTILALLTGFRPDSPSVRSGVFVSTQGAARVGSPFGSNMRVLSMAAGETLDGSVTFTTSDPWPTTLPGAAA